MKISCLHRAMKVSWQGSTMLCVSLTGPWLHSDHSNEEVSSEAFIHASQSLLICAVLVIADPKIKGNLRCYQIVCTKA